MDLCCVRRDVNATDAFFDRYKPTHVIHFAAIDESYGTCGGWEDVTWTGTAVGGLFKIMKYKVCRDHRSIIRLVVSLLMAFLCLDNSSPSSATTL